MISLEQVRALEDRVEKAVAYIASLRGEAAEFARRLAEAQTFIDDAASEMATAEERASSAERRADAADSLRQAEASAAATRIREFESRLADMAERVASAEARAAELTARAEEYRRDQAKIEEGIVHALAKLDSFEDLVLSQPAAAENDPPEASSEEAASGSGIAVKSEPAANELDIF